MKTVVLSTAHADAGRGATTARTFTALLAILMLVGALLVPANRASLISTGETLTDSARSLVDAGALSAEEAALRAQLEAIGSGLTFDTQVGGLEANFMLAGPVFAQSTTPFSIATSTYQDVAVAAVVPEYDGDRIIYDRGAVTEWWRQAGSSYEQGWTVASAPTNGETTLSLLVGFANAAPLAESDTTVQLRLSDGSIAWYRDLHAFDANGTVLPATMTVDGSNVRIDVDAAGAAYPVTIDPIVDADQKILPPATATGDLFGEAIATDGNRTAISAREADRPANPDAGAGRGRVDIFDWNTGTTAFDLLDSVDYPGAGSADFGWSLDVSGPYLAVGAPLDDTNGANAGAVFVYQYDGSDYNLIQTVYACSPAGVPCDGTATSGFDGANFGYDVAIASDKTLAVGAPGGVFTDTGQAYVFSPTGAGGDLELKSTALLAASATPAIRVGDRFGEAIDISADNELVIVGAPGDDTDATDEGRVFLFAESAGVAGSYVSAGTEVGPSNGVSMEYGASVALGIDSESQDIAVVGRPFRTRRNPVDTGPGGVEVLMAGPGGFGSVGLGDISSFTASPDGFGFSVGFHKDVVVVGAPYNAGVTPERGFAWGFTYIPIGQTMDNGGAGASAAPRANPFDFGAVGGDRLGWSVAVLDGGDLVAGLPGHDELQNNRVAHDAGRATQWAPGSVVTDVVGAELTAATDNQFGYSVTISGDLMAAGSPTDDGTGSSDGALLFYDRESAADPWVFTQAFTYPDSASETAGLYAASIDMEGGFLAAGTATGQFGRVDVYEESGGAWTLRSSLEGPPADNTVNSLEFGSDVAISADGDILVVGIAGQDTGCDNCGAVRIYDWDGVNYLERTTIEGNNAFEQVGVSLDMAEISATGDHRLVLGKVGGGGDGALDIYTVDDVGTGVSIDDLLDTVQSIGESVAIDDDRIAAARLSDTGDLLYVLDRSPDGRWTQREIFSGILFQGTGTLPNNQVDVSGDTIAIGRSGSGGEVAVFYNDPAFGWGQVDVTNGWIDGPLDLIQPANREVNDKIGRAVAIDGFGGTKTIIAGAPGDDDAGDGAGAVFSTDFAEAGVAPGNKITSPGFANPNGGGSPVGLGNAISVGTTPFGPTAVVAERSGQRVHRLEPSGANWEIVQTLEFFTNVTDVDLRESDGTMVVLFQDGNVLTYREDTCGGADCTFSQISGPFDVGQVNEGSIEIGETSDDTLVMIESGSGDQFQQLIDFGTGGNGPVGPPGGVVPADLFGASADTEGRYTFIGAPGTDTGLGANTGRVYVWDNQNLSYPLSIDGLVAGAKFGSSVAIDGNTLVIGAEDDGVIFDGLAYVYDFQSAVSLTATRIQTLSPAGGSGLSHWGTSAAIDGDTIVLGATGYQESGVPFRDGTAVAFGFNGTDWVQTDLFDHADDASADGAGAAVGVLGNNVFVGVPFDDNTQGIDAGAVYTYVASAAPPSIPNKILTADASGEFGRELAVSGTTAVVAETGGDRVHILEQDAGVWTITQTFNEANVVDVDIDDAAGRMVVVKSDGDVVYYERTLGSYGSVGGTTLSPNGNPTSVLLANNVVYVGKNSTTAALVRLAWLSTGTGNEFAPAGIIAGEETGASLAEDNGVVFVGAPRWDSVAGGANDEAGRVYIFDNDSNTFTGTIEPTNPGILFGFSLDADNGRLAVGALSNATAPAGGSVETYTNLSTTGADLEQVVTADDLVTSDFFGFSVDLEGDLMVVGSAAKSVGGTRTGQAYSFNLIGGVWTQQDTFTASDNGFDDQFGNAIGVSGTSVLVGAPFDDNARGTDAGSVYFFTASAAPDNPTLSFDIGLDPNGPTSVAVAPTGIAVSEFDAETIEDAAEDDSSIAAASFGATDIADSPISALPISALPISALAQDPTSPLFSIPLTQITIDTDGGWPAILAGTPLAGVPLVDLTLGDVVNNAVADGNLASTPISALEVNGTPISALPISALLLGELPISALDAADPDTDWCSILATYLPAADCNTTSLVEATLVGTPISALPISALPISALPISALPNSLPISALELSDLDLSQSPISALPISALPISALPISALPISALPISALPISALPISALDLNASPISALELSAAPISALELRNVPISALDVEGAPISALPISALPISALLLQDVNLVDIPIDGDWCDLLADLAGYDCSFATDETAFLANTTIHDLGVRGVPISALPISALPISALPISALPISALPISALPISALPISALPISALPISALPISALGVPDLQSVPILALQVQGSPISALPISALDLNTSPISALPISALPISALPISALPISALQVNGTPISALPISALDIGSTPISALPISALPISALGIDCDLVDCDIDSLLDALVAGAIDPGTTIGDLGPNLSGIRLGDIAEQVAAATGGTVQDVIDAAGASPLLLNQLGDVDDLTLGDLPQSDPLVQQLLLGDFASVLWQLRLSDLVGTLIDPTTGAPFSDTAVEDSLTQLLAAVPGTPTLGDIDVAGDMTLADILAGDTTGFELGDLGGILGLVHITDLLNVTAQSGVIGDLTADELGDITLLDLLGITEIDNLTLGQLFDAANANDALIGFDIGDLLLALLGVESAPFSNLDFTEIESGALPESLIPPATFRAEFEVMDTSIARSVEVTAQLPATATYVPGSALVIDEDNTLFEAEPVVGANTLTWTVNGAQPDKIVFVNFDVRPTVSLGATSITATAKIIGTDVEGSGVASISVTEGTEPNDFPDTTPAVEDTIYLTYISSETDNDVYEITVLENDQLAIQLSSLTSDLDFALYGTPTNGAVNTALTDASDEAPLEPITDPDQEGADTEPLNDFRRLDDEDATLDFVDLSNSPGTETELLITDALPAGTYYVQVFGANGATNVEPAALQIQILEAEDRPDCAAQGPVTGAPGTAPPLGGSTANTVFLVNQQRTEFLYPGEWADLDAELNDLVTYLTTDPAGQALGIDPIVVPVDGLGSVQAAYAAWDGDGSCSPETANAVVQAIIENAIDPLRDTLEHVVVVGGDPVIPMARLLDVTEVANEYDFRHEFIGDNAIGATNTDINALSASFWDRQYLSDEPYGESAARSLGNRFLYVSDIALGRMVETPDEIQAQLQHFQDFNGSLDVNTAAVLGYDFLVDSSEEIAADLVAAGVTVDDELADGLDAGGDKWDRLDAEGKVIPAGTAPDLISLNGHFDHYRALPADGDQVPNFTNNFLADTVANATPGLLQGSIIFSMGCHGGLSVSDLQINPGADNTNGDWAQTFAADQAIFVGNTGFGYGDTEAVAYTEKLMALFAEQAIRPIQVPTSGTTTTIGQALTFAKNEYASDLSVFSVYDEKALMESTFYGLPFYRVGATPVAPAPVPDTTTVPDTTGNESFSFTADAENNLETTPLGDIYSNPDENGDPQVIVAPGMPVQPSQSFDVSVVDPADSTELDSIARGALVLDMTSTYASPVDPVVSTAIFNESVNQPEPELGDVVFPAKPVTLNSTTTPGGARQNLVLATGQFDSDGSVQRLDDNIDVIVYYSPGTDDDFTAPTIGAVESALATTPGGVEFSVSLSATDMGGTDAPVVTRVYVLVAPNPGVGTVDWVGLDLVQAGTTNEWSGSVLLPAGTTDVEFLVQGVDGSGNVGIATNKARNFDDDDIPVVDPPAPDLTVTVDQANFDAPSGWYTGPATVTVDSGNQAATYLIQPGGTETTVPVGGTFVVDSDGVNAVTVTRADGQTVTETIRVDTTDPTVSIAPPANGAVFFESDVPNVGFACQDPSLTTCSATADGDPIENSDPLPSTVGAHTVIATAVDALGNTETATVGYMVVADPPVGDPPVITESEIDGVSLPGEPVDLYGEFVDGVGPFTISVDWGNGDSCPGDGTCSVEAPGAGMPGTFEASYTYPVGGNFTAEVTITDANGQTATTLLTSATCTITGTNGDDVLWGTGGDDVICGLGGNDRINGRAGADLIFGGRGADVIRGANGPDTLFGGRGSDVLIGQGGSDTLIGGGGGDLLVGSNGADVLKGRSGHDVLIGSYGNDTLIGNRGDDQLYGGDGADNLQGRRGNDFIAGWIGRDTISGGSGADVIFGGGGQDTISGGSGEDWISGGSGADTINGDEDDDDLFGDGGPDTIDGGDGTDKCRGGAGTDTLTACEV